MTRQLLPLLLLACTDVAPDIGCTEIGCSSTFELVVIHDLDLDVDGFTTLTLTAPSLGEITCTVGRTAEGSDSCFGYRFADIDWAPGRLTLTLTDPFFVTDATPDGEPFASYHLSLTVADTVVLDAQAETGSVQKLQPNGEGCPPVCYQVQRTHTVPPQERR